MIRRVVAGALGLALAVCTSIQADAQPDAADQIAQIASEATPVPPTLLASRAGLAIVGADSLAQALPANAPALLPLLSRRDDSPTLSLPAALSDEAVADDGSAVRTTPGGEFAALIESGDSTRLQLLLPDATAVTLLAHGQSQPASIGRAIVMKAADGSVSGGLAPPSARDSQGATVQARYEVDGERIRVTVEPGEKTVFPVAVEIMLGGDMVEDFTWESDTRVLVTPAQWVRALAPGDPIGAPQLAAAVFAELRELQAAEQRDLLGSSAENQLACHMVGARDKDTWNLETDRPDKGFVRFLTSSCN